MNQFLIAALIVIGLGTITVLGISFIKPEADNTSLIAISFAFLTSTFTAILAYLKIQETHKIVNSRMDEFRAELQQSSSKDATIAYDSGHAAGTVDANKRTDDLSKQ